MKNNRNIILTILQKIGKKTSLDNSRRLVLRKTTHVQISGLDFSYKMPDNIVIPYDYNNFALFIRNNKAKENIYSNLVIKDMIFNNVGIKLSADITPLNITIEDITIYW